MHARQNMEKFSVSVEKRDFTTIGAMIFKASISEDLTRIKEYNKSDFETFYRDVLY